MSDTPHSLAEHLAERLSALLAERKPQAAAVLDALEAFHVAAIRALALEVCDTSEQRRALYGMAMEQWHTDMLLAIRDTYD